MAAPLSTISRQILALSFFISLSSLSVSTNRNAVIKKTDMADDMQQDAVDVATLALEKYNIEKDIAAFITKEFDKKYNPTWHCIVKRNFGKYETKYTNFIYFYIGQFAVFIYKSGKRDKNKISRKC